MKHKFFLLFFALLGTLGVVNGQVKYNTQNVSPEPGKTYSYDFTDGSVFEQTQDTRYDEFIIESGIVTLKSNTGSQFRYHNDHGIITSSGLSVEIAVAGNAVISFNACQWSAGDAVFNLTDAAGKDLGSVDAVSSGSCSPIVYNYTGDAGVIIATLSASNSVYLHGITIANEAAEVKVEPGKTYSYDFTDGSVFEQTQEIRYDDFVIEGGIVTIKRNTGSQFRYHNDHGIILSSGNSIDIAVAGNAVISFGNCLHSAAGAVFNLTDKAGNDLGSVAAVAAGSCSPTVFEYTGASGVITATLSASGTVYFHGMSIANEGEVVNVEPGKTYSYDFTDGSVFEQTQEIRYDDFVIEGGIVTIKRNTGVQFRYHNDHGIILSSGNSIDIAVAGNAVISFGNCVHSAAGAVFNLTDKAGNDLGSVAAVASGSCSPTNFEYTGAAGVITATLTASGTVYFHGITIENESDEPIVRSEKTDVWDFGAAQFDEEKYNNHLTEDVINSWYPGVAPGTAGVSLPGGFTVGGLTYVGGTNSDRIRTSNENLTRHDAQGAGEKYGDEVFTGSLYINASGATGRYLELNLKEDDELTLYVKSQEGKGKLTFQYMNGDTQTEVNDVTKEVSENKFIAHKRGTYRVYDTVDKPFYYRILRKDATYVTVSGALNTTGAATIPATYSLILTNNETGKEFTAALTSDATSYSLEVPAGYTYTLSLGNANGFIITNGTTLAIEADTNRDIVIEEVLTVALSGAIQGLSNDQLERLKLVFTPVNEELIYVPAPVIDVAASTYKVNIEPNAKYIISAAGVNDYAITNNEVTIANDGTFNIVFAAKPTHKIDIVANKLETEHISRLSVTFTNLNEPEYAYTFTSLSDISLRDGVYAISCGGLDEYPLELAPTSNLTVNGGEVSKHIEFRIVNNWAFDDREIATGETAYKGLLFTGKIKTESKGHLVVSDDATVKVPVNPGEKLIITYYFTADFSVEDGEAVTTSSKSTSRFETVEYIYEGTTPGHMTITNNSGDTYLPNIETMAVVEYAPVITVGADKEYQTINDALAAVRAMDRPESERVKIMVDPGNYEEMLVIDVDSISIINASVTPSIALMNQGVDIDENAVRITGYYGHGYNYFSMGTDQKWNEDALRVNKENGYTNYSNAGSGTTNSSYWNATVVVTAPGFEAYDIIFENSFNQYISKKESEDVVVEWEKDGKGTRPTEYGNTAVQNKSFVERAAAIAYTAGADKSILGNCRVIGRQDTFYGAQGVRVVAYKGVLMGGTDYLFGGMTLVAYQSDLAMNTSDASSDVSYITAAQHSSSSVRGYLLYNCTITSAEPGTETASQYLSKPGYFGRPWTANTSEVVFYNNLIKATNHAGYEGKSMIRAEGWNSSLSGESERCYEFGSVQESGEDHSNDRASWTTVLTASTLPDGTEISTYNFTKGDDGWDPIPGLITGIEDVVVKNNDNKVNFKQRGNTLEVLDITTATTISVYGINGTLADIVTVAEDTELTLKQGFWIVRAANAEGQAVIKVLVP